MALFGDSTFIEVIELNEISGQVKFSTTGIRVTKREKDTEIDTRGRKMIERHREETAVYKPGREAGN